MAEAPVTPAKAKNPDVELLFQKMGEKLGWFQHKDLDTAMKNLTKSGKKKSVRSRVKERSGDADCSNKENRAGKSSTTSHNKEHSEKEKKNKHKPRKKDRSASHTADSQSTENSNGYPLKPSKASTDLTQVKHKEKKVTRVSESPLDDQKCLQESNESSKNKSSNRYSNEGSNYDSFPEMPSMLEDIGAPLVESTRIHSRESISFYKLGDESEHSLDQSSFENLRISSGDGGHRYIRTDTTLIRVRNSLGVNEFKKPKQLDLSDKYFSVVCESVLGEEEEVEEEYHSVLEESPLMKKNETEGSHKSECDVVEESPLLTKDVSIKNSSSNVCQDSPEIIGDSIGPSYSGPKSHVVESASWVRKTVQSEDVSEIMVRDKHERKDDEDIRIKYRETPEAESVVEQDSESGGSFYEVEDACAQTDLQGDEGVEAEESELDSDVEEGATIIENKLQEMDLGKKEQKCWNRGFVSEASSEDDKPSGVSNQEMQTGNIAEDRNSKTEAEDTSYTAKYKNSKNRNTKKKVHSLSASPSDQSYSDGSFYEVVDQCVQTEADDSQNSAQTSSSVVTPDSCSSKTSLYFQKSSGSVSSTPRLAELQSATYEKLRMSLKKFPASPSPAVNVMENVLKKVNLFGTKPRSCLKAGNKSDDSKKVPKLETPGKAFSVVEKSPEKGKISSECESDKSSYKERVMSMKLEDRKELNKDVSKSKDVSMKLSISIKQSSHVSPSIKSAPVKIDKNEEQNKLVDNIAKCNINESANRTDTKTSSTVFQTPLKTVPLETPSRRTKLSLKKLPKKSSSISSATSDENKELYKTGFSSPDYSCESPKQTKACSKTTLFKCNQMVKMVQESPENKQQLESKCSSEPKALIRIPDSPPLLSDNGSGQHSNEDLFSDKGMEGVPDSESEDEFHSMYVPKETETKAKTKNKSSTVKTTAQYDISSDEEEVFQKRKKKVKRGDNSKRTVSWQKNDDSDDSLPDINTKPDQNDRYCITVSDTSTWRSSKTVSDSSEEDLDSFFQKMKAPKKPTKMKSSSSESAESDKDSMKDFIVDDSDVEREPDEDIFYLKTDNSRKDKSPRVPRYVPSSEEESMESEEGEEETYRRSTPGGKPSQKTHETPLPKVAPRQYKTPKSQVLSRPVIPSSAKSCNVSVKTASFLSSLSDNLGENRRHPDAVNYVKQFKKYKGELTLRLMKLFNQTVFDGKLPSSLEISWNNRMLKTAGYCKYMRHHTAKVELSDKVCDSAVCKYWSAEELNREKTLKRVCWTSSTAHARERVRDTLIHELCHAASWVLNHKNDGHGPYWKYWARKANKSHPEIPVISRCHNYAIATKYTYKCVGCGYSIGRHSKSLDTERKVCGKCHGRFEVFLTKDVASSASSSLSKTQKTPRTPNRFALFVKEKYGVYKKNKDLKHKDIMQLLSQEFATKNKLND